MKKYWYEVFKRNGFGETETIASFNLLKQAKEFKKKHNVTAQLMGETLHIDKWQEINDFPEPVEEIE